MLILFPEEAVSAAKQGLILWYTTVLPSLFPFAVGTSLLISLNAVSLISKAAAPVSKRLFGISSEGFFVFLSGILSGYPIGIHTLTEMYEKRLISRPEAVRLSVWCSNSGPLFILGSIGALMLKDSSAGKIILISHYAAPVILGILLKPKGERAENLNFKKSAEPMAFGKALSLSVEKGCRSMLLVGGFIVFFSVITEIISMTGILSIISLPLSLLGIDSRLTESLILASAEMTKGCRLTADLNTPLKLPFLCFAVSFGGFCVHAQSLSLLEEANLPWKPYITGKVICGFISLFVCIIILRAKAAL